MHCRKINKGEKIILNIKRIFCTEKLQLTNFAIVCKEKKSTNLDNINYFQICIKSNNIKMKIYVKKF